MNKKCNEYETTVCDGGLQWEGPEAGNKEKKVL